MCNVWCHVMLQLHCIDCLFHSVDTADTLHHASTEDERTLIRTAEVYVEFCFVENCRVTAKLCEVRWGPCDANTGSPLLNRLWQWDTPTTPPLHNMISSSKLSAPVYTSFIKYLESANKYTRLSVSSVEREILFRNPESGESYFNISQQLQLPLTLTAWHRYCGLEENLISHHNKVSSMTFHWYWSGSRAPG